MEKNQNNDFKLIVSTSDEKPASNEIPWKLKISFTNIEVFINCTSSEKLFELFEVLKNV